MNARALIVAAIAAPTFAWAQTYPVKPIRIIVPYPPGGGTDLVARFVGKQIGEQLGQAVIVENRPGAGGNIGTEAIARAAADGHTLGIATPGPTTIAASLHANLAYDPKTSFAAVSLVAQQPIVLLTHPSLPVRSVKELVALAKARPDQLNAAVTTATVPHLLTELLKSSTGARMASIGYKGGVQARTDLIAGRVELMFSVLVTAMPFLNPPKVRALAIASAQRSALIPDVPTMREAGYGGMEGAVWTGVIAPAGTPAAVVQRLHGVVAKTIGAAETKRLFESLAMDPVQASPDQFQQFMNAEIELWRKIIGSSNIKVED
jgi:tripartite-type tricarboxylate transporter receptor subunit TctC